MNTNSVDFFQLSEIKPLTEANQLILAVWEIRNPENIGHIIRIAHNVGAVKVVLINTKKIFRNPRIEKTAGFSFRQMEWNFISKQEFMDLIQSDFSLVVLETYSGAKNIFEQNLPPQNHIACRKRIIRLAGRNSKFKRFKSFYSNARRLQIDECFACAIGRIVRMVPANFSVEM